MMNNWKVKINKRMIKKMNNKLQRVKLKNEKENESKKQESAAENTFVLILKKYSKLQMI